MQKEIGKRSVHYWLNVKYGKPKKCEFCGTTDKDKWYDWANKDHKYRKLRADFKRLCRSCHRKYDHKKGKWTFQILDKRKCIICNKEFQPNGGNHRKCGTVREKTGCAYKYFVDYHLIRYHTIYSRVARTALTKLDETNL